MPARDGPAAHNGRGRKADWQDRVPASFHELAESLQAMNAYLKAALRLESASPPPANKTIEALKKIDAQHGRAIAAFKELSGHLQRSVETRGKEKRQLLGKGSATDDESKKRKLASRAFALAQDAEAAERSGENPQHGARK